MVYYTYIIELYRVLVFKTIGVVVAMKKPFTAYYAIVLVAPFAHRRIFGHAFAPENVYASTSKITANFSVKDFST